MAILVIHLTQENLPELQGSYDAWQELFSNMVDEMLMSQSIAHMDVDLLLEILELSHHYRVHSLEELYLRKLEGMLSEENVLKVRYFVAEVYLLMSSDPSVFNGNFTPKFNWITKNRN